MGSSIARDLIKSGDVTQVLLADINVDMAKVAESVQMSSKVSVQYFDVTKSFPELVKVIRGKDIVINTVAPYPEFGTDVVEAAIEAGVSYVDICDDCSVTRAIFELDESARKAGVTICTGLGFTPGITNMLAKYGADQLDAVDEIGIFFVIALIDPIGRAGLMQAMGQFIGNVTQYIDGRLVDVPAGSSGEEIEFMEPFGKTEAYYARHPEPFTLPRYIPGVKRVINKATFSPSSVPKLFEQFVELGLFNTEPIPVGNIFVSPRDFTVSFVQHTPGLRGQPKPGASIAANVVVKGREGSKSVTYTCLTCGWGGPLIAIPASIGAQMLGRGEVKVTGVVAPEGAFDPKKFFAELAKKGIHFLEKKTSEQEITLQER